MNIRQVSQLLLRQKPNRMKTEHGHWFKMMHMMLPDFRYVSVCRLRWMHLVMIIQKFTGCGAVVILTAYLQKGRMIS